MIIFLVEVQQYYDDGFWGMLRVASFYAFLVLVSADGHTTRKFADRNTS